jgi:hypothetical protein
MFSRASQPRTGPRPLRDALRRAADLIVAFATLEDVSGPRDHPGGHGTHPHRRPLRTPAHARRPGAVAARPAVCTSPVAATGAVPASGARIGAAGAGTAWGAGIGAAGGDPAWGARVASAAASRRVAQRRRAAHVGGS